MGAAPSPGWLIARQSARFVLRERTVALLSLLFVVLVVMSAWLGWSATQAVNRIYLDAAAFLKSTGQPVPTNPVLDISLLSLMRNMSVYVALIGALSAIVIGNRLVGLDRKAGVLPLIGIRPLSRNEYASGKIMALTGLITTLAAVTAPVAVTTFLLLPAITLTGLQWAQLAGFMGVTTLYMGIFGLIGLAAGAARIIPEQLRIFKIYSVFKLITLAFFRVVLKHLTFSSIADIPLLYIPLIFGAGSQGKKIQVTIAPCWSNNSLEWNRDQRA